MRIIIHIFSTVILLLSSAGIYSQVPESNLRSLNLTVGDSVIKTHFTTAYTKKKLIPAAPYFWYASGKIQFNCGSYSGKLLHGKFEMFDKNNKLIQQGNFDYGLKQGAWNIWYPNGLKKVVLFYKDGMPQGECLQYDQNGVLVSKQIYHDGVLHGKCLYYFPDTVLFKQYKYGKEIIKPVKIKKTTHKKTVKVKKQEQLSEKVTTATSESKNDSIPAKKKNAFLKLIKKPQKKGNVDEKD